MTSIFICIFSTFIALLLYRYVYLYFLIKNWNEDLEAYVNHCYRYGIGHAEYYSRQKLKIGINLFYLNKWFISDLLNDPFTFMDVNNFMREQRKAIRKEKP